MKLYLVETDMGVHAEFKWASCKIGNASSHLSPVAFR